MTERPSFWNAVMPSHPSIDTRPVAGVDTRVLIAGAAHRDEGVLLLIHGTSGHLESFVYNVADLARDRMVVAYDLPWHGYSGIPDSFYDVAAFVEHAVALLDEVDGAPCTILGHSLGAWIAARLALDRPELVSKLVLIGAGGAEGDDYPGQSSMREHLAPGRTREVVSARLRFAAGAEVPDELIGCRLGTYQAGSWEDRVRAFTYQREPDVWERNHISVAEWSSLGQPVLLIWGSEDRVVPISVGRRLHEWIPHSRFEVIEGAGHVPQFEEPAVLNQLITQFVAEP